jgi:hypothetical protein
MLELDPFLVARGFGQFRLRPSVLRLRAEGCTKKDDRQQEYSFHNLNLVLSSV